MKAIKYSHGENIKESKDHKHGNRGRRIRKKLMKKATKDLIKDIIKE